MLTKLISVNNVHGILKITYRKFISCAIVSNEIGVGFTRWELKWKFQTGTFISPSWALGCLPSVKTAPWVYRLICWIDNIYELFCWTCQGVEVLMMLLHRTEDYEGRIEWACLSEEDIHCLAEMTPFKLGLELQPRICNFEELTNFHSKLTLLRASPILKLLIVWANVKWMCFS